MSDRFKARYRWLGVASRHVYTLTISKFNLVEDRMGISGWLARKGNVGGTARWAGHGYWLFTKKNPNATIEQVMAALV